MSAAALELALRAHGIRARVEAHGRLAVLVPDEAALENAHERMQLSHERERALALALLPDHGFTHLALELVEPARRRAAIPGD